MPIPRLTVHIFDTVKARLEPVHNRDGHGAKGLCHRKIVRSSVVDKYF
jgi:hypothetical protein